MKELRKYNKKKILKMAGLILVAALLAGCGSGTETGTQESGLIESESIEKETEQISLEDDAKETSESEMPTESGDDNNSTVVTKQEKYSAETYLYKERLVAEMGVIEDRIMFSDVDDYEGNGNLCGFDMVGEIEAEGILTVTDIFYRENGIVSVNYNDDVLPLTTYDNANYDLNKGEYLDAWDMGTNTWQGSNFEGTYRASILE